ncbi:MAG: hypothetical protein MI723_09040, partial [Caulobacterales bacterium]|nr:hypothetical protein [Caulobacterales bacterium]
GVFPGPLYSILPYEVNYVPYTVTHVITQLQLLMFSALAFTLLMRTGVYPPEKPGVNLDFDWVYRRLGLGVARWGLAVWGRMAAHARNGLARVARQVDDHLHAVFSPAGALNRAVPNVALAVWTALILGAALVVVFLAPA